MRVRREIDAPVELVWAAVTDWESHPRWVAMTTVAVVSEHATGVGARFITRTGIGALAFEDPMVVTRWQPPDAGVDAHCTLVKQGRVLHGTADIAVVALGPGRCRLDWAEDVEMAGLHRLPGSRWLTERVGRAVFGSVVRRMARDIESAYERLDA